MSDDVAVFFYGLFMDEAVLAQNGVQGRAPRLGYVEGYALRIGTRATLERHPDSRAYGVLMHIDQGTVHRLYCEPYVADYLPCPLTVTLDNGRIEEAVSYLLPAEDLTGSNSDYAEQLLALGSRLGFPDSYLQVIRQEGGLG